MWVLATKTSILLCVCMVQLIDVLVRFFFNVPSSGSMLVIVTWLIFRTILLFCGASTPMVCVFFLFRFHRQKRTKERNKLIGSCCPMSHRVHGIWFEEEFRMGATGHTLLAFTILKLIVNHIFTIGQSSRFIN